MFELLDSINHWHWLAFGLALLAVELLGTAGYFLWLGLSALIVGAVLTVVPMSWQLQWTSFGAFSLITTWLWWRRQLSQDKRSDSRRQLNQKEKQLIGEVVTLSEDFPSGKGRIKLGDTTWTARSETPLQAGTQVVVTDVDGIVLTIKQKN
ncbi:NfeD family protein [Vibrio sp. MarTm2]|uniref:NfeD family protein n=1 Tax=unclassified Vibrio TaxID=2614977 RepID=UPI00018F204C|nr:MULTISPECIES: NfeD family protein [unclassified Vibrio]EED25624.1 membrane protein [Vibrio sp. 16]MDA0127003.1 NfeD family protein [Vibrio sp. MarTm2]CAK4069072.1 Inner membrane protein YbbJ [Vibrio sp. 16]